MQYRYTVRANLDFISKRDILECTVYSHTQGFEVNTCDIASERPIVYLYNMAGQRLEHKHFLTLLDSSRLADNELFNLWPTSPLIFDT